MATDRRPDGPAAPAVSSPCVGVCTVGPGGLCIGCFRTMEEIACWSALPEATRREIMDVLPARGDALFE